MNWSTPGDLRAQLQNLWARGDLLAGLVTGEAQFPKRLVLKTPTSAEMAGHFDQVRDWIAELRAMPRCRVEMREFRHRVLGSNAVPHEAWIDCREDAVSLLGKQRDVARFVALLETTRQRQPSLLAWLASRPLRALELCDDWDRLLDIVAWLQANPRPGVYLRQIDIPGVHSKFIEARRGVLGELLDRALPPAAINTEASGVSQFAARYGLRDKPLLIRFRALDPAHSLLPGSVAHDITLDAASFAALDCRVSRVFITENEINFLTFPQVQGSLVIFGAGYGFETLRAANWLTRCHIHYWGDIDTHGFAILDQLRSQFEHVQSFLMDRTTLLTFTAHWGQEEKPTLRDLPRLKPEEKALYDDLRDNRISEKLRLEQERIGFGWLTAELTRLVSGEA